MKKGALIVISGPSGTGKGTICSLLCRQNSKMHCSISLTTRFPRKGESDGTNYHFLTEEKFKTLLKQGSLLEWAKVYGHYYGTLQQQVEEKRAQGCDVILEIDTQGAKQVRSKVEDAALIFLLPPSMDELWARIQGRGTDSPAAIEERFAAAYREIQEIWKYDYVVTNENIPETVRKVEAIILAEKCRVGRNKNILCGLKEGEKQ